MGYAYALFIFALALLSASAVADVGLVVEFPDGSVHTECVEVSDGASAYSILKSSGLESGWSSSSEWGHALCMINGVGSAPAGDACSDWSSYWAFSLALDGDGGWTAHSPVGYDAGGCWNRDYETPSYDGHYCAQDGDVLGFHFTDEFPSGHPEFSSFGEICTKQDDAGPVRKTLLMTSRPFWKSYTGKCGIPYDETLAPQNIVRMCKDKMAQDAAALAARGCDSLKEMSYTYSPHVITMPGEIFTIRFPIPAGATVFVNGAELKTYEDGSVSFSVRNGEYLVELAYPCYKDFKKRFVIG